MDNSRGKTPAFLCQFLGKVGKVRTKTNFYFKVGDFNFIRKSNYPQNGLLHLKKGSYTGQIGNKFT